MQIVMGNLQILTWDFASHCEIYDYIDIIMGAIASQITCLTIVSSTIYSGADQRKYGVTGLCVGNSPLTGEFPAQMASNTEMFPFDDVIMVVASIRYYPRQTNDTANRKFRPKHGHICSHSCDDKMWLGVTSPTRTNGHVRLKIMYLTSKRWLYDDVGVNGYI